MIKKEDIKIGSVFFEVDVNEYLLVNIEKIKITDEIREGVFKYVGIEQIINRDFEIPETESEKLKKKHNHWHYDSRRIPGRTVEGTSKFEQDNLIFELTTDFIVSAVKKRIEQNELSEKNALRCPITGGKLICTGSDMGVMDGSIRWIVEGHENIKWETGSRHFSEIFFNSEYGNYKFNYKTREWNEQVIYADGWKSIDKPKTEEEEENLKNLIKEYEEKKERDKEEYRKKVESGEISEFLLPSAKKIYAQTVNSESVESVPMESPSSNLFFIDKKNNI